MMRDEDRDPTWSPFDILDDDPDFDSIRGGKSTKGADQDPEAPPEPETDEQQRLTDRLVPTAEAAPISTDTHQPTTISQPSAHPAYQTETVATIRDIVTVAPRRSISVVKPTTVVLEPKDPPSEVFPLMAESVGVGSFERQSSRRVTDPVRLQERLPKETEGFGTIRQQALATDDQNITTVMIPNSVSTGTRPEPEPEKLDPGYDWTGGMPYTTTTPQCIIHVDPEDVESLPFLQRVLRDTYTELEGGRPRTETLSPRAGILNRTRVHGSVVTLDLTTEEWMVDIEDRTASISYEDRELLPKVQALIDSLYGGKLGYLVLNVDAAAFESRFRSDLREAFIASLLDMSTDSVELNSEDTLFRVEPPIRIAEPRYQEPAAFRQVQAQYFGFSISESEADILADLRSSRVANLEAAQESRIRQNDWRRIALTERQREETGGESDEHYLWKAALADGIAWHMKEQYAEQNEKLTFARFVRRHLVSGGPIESEADIEDDGKADLRISTEDLWAWNGVRAFLEDTPLEPSQETTVAIEFETGRSEGAFNFRKVRETLGKYDRKSRYKICVVVPPRVLFRSESRGRMIEQLVAKWPSNDSAAVDAALCVPHLGQYGCRRLVGGSRLLDAWFSDAE